ncbi:hypothetical protein Dimus_008171 [Dionaea muscipula]
MWQRSALIKLLPVKFHVSAFSGTKALKNIFKNKEEPVTYLRHALANLCQLHFQRHVLHDLPVSWHRHTPHPVHNHVVRLGVAKNTRGEDESAILYFPCG